MFKKYWLIFFIFSLFFLILVAGCVSSLSKRPISSNSLGFYEIEQGIPQYSQSVYIPKKGIIPPPNVPIISSINISNSVCDFLDIYLNNNKAYATYSDAKQNYKVMVKIYNGKQWEYLGTNPITDDHAYWPNIEIVNNKPVVFYVDRKNNFSVSGKIFNESWNYIPLNELPVSRVGVLKTHTKSDTLFLAYSDLTSGGIIAASWKNKVWTILPAINRYNQQILDLALMTIKDDVYVALIDSSNEYKILVYKLNKDQWDVVGEFSVIDYLAGDLSLSSDGNNPYISYITYKDASSSCKVNVKRFNGKEWKNIGNPYSTPGKARFAELQIVNNQVLLAYADLETQKPTVLRLMKDNWTAITRSADSKGKTSQLVHRVYKNFSYVGYLDEENNYSAVALPLPSTELIQSNY
ncbi:MAG: hypothetical protein PHF25_03220 [Candidatus Margulisbacteria bacterium]|nr:hypothetical protein [Candidatus Margulisiibacteriota bacterium]